MASCRRKRLDATSKGVAAHQRDWIGSMIFSDKLHASAKRVVFE